MATRKKTKKKTTTRKKTASRSKKSPKKAPQLSDLALDEDDLDELEDDLLDEEEEEQAEEYDAPASEENPDVQASLDVDFSDPDEVAEFCQRQEGETVFDFGDRLNNAGLPHFYHVLRSGEWLGRDDHPFSIEKLKEKYGGGVYVVQLKDATTKRLRAQETFRLGGTPKVSNFGEPAHEQETKPTQNESFGMREFLAFQEQNKQTMKQEMEERAARDKESSQTIMQMMLQMQQQSTNQLSQMMMQSQESTKQLIQAMNDQSNRNMTMLQDQIRAIAEAANKKPEMGLTEMLALINDSRASGKNEFMQLMELMDSKADDKAEVERRFLELKAEMKSGSESQKQSSIDRLIEALAPAVAGQMLQGGAPQPQAVPHQPQPTSHGQVVPIKPNDPEAQKKAREQAVQKQKALMAQKKEFIQKKHQEMSEAMSLKPKKEGESVSTKEKIEGILKLKAPTWVLTNRNPEKCAREALAMLTERGITKEDIRANYNVNDLLSIGKKLSLPKDRMEWIKSFWGYVEKEIKEKPTGATQGAVSN